MADWYLPGYKAGGPVRTLANIIAKFGDDFEFSVITRDRDLGDASPYPGVEQNRWREVGKARVCYLPSLSLRNIWYWMHEAGPDIIYLNSFFSPLSRAVLLLRYAGRLPTHTVILAPRGELSPAALSLKRFRKRPYLALSRAAGLLRHDLWQASCEAEREQIITAIGPNAEVHVAPDLLSEPEPALDSATLPKTPGTGRFVFLSRISPMKNPEYFLQLLAGARGRVEFDIFGPAEDHAYWSRCQRTIAEMPQGVTVQYCGPVPSHEVAATISQYHFFVLPTRGENFCHAIAEALAVGCPVLISDQTPWSNLPARQAGWALPLADEDAWKRVLQECVDMNQSRYDELSAGARHFARTCMSAAQNSQLTAALFDKALRQRHVL